jgi:acetyl-CoA carboxylase carboxyltransferase component
VALGGRSVRPDLLLAWPTAELGFMAPDTGVRTACRRRLEAAEREGGSAARDQLAAELEAEWAAESQPWKAAANVILDDVVNPRDTHATIAAGIAFAWGTRRRVRTCGCG